MFNLGLTIYLVFVQGMPIAGFEDRQLTQACEVAAAVALKAKSEASVYRVRYSPAGAVYAVNCSTPRCAEPPASVYVEEIGCRLIPAKTTNSVEPEHWEAGPAGQP